MTPKHSAVYSFQMLSQGYKQSILPALNKLLSATVGSRFAVDQVTVILHGIY